MQKRKDGYEAMTFIVSQENKKFLKKYSFDKQITMSDVLDDLLTTLKNYIDEKINEENLSGGV